jgi:hypothetical protein
MESSDEAEDILECVTQNQGLNPYQFEPECDEDQEESEESEGESDDSLGNDRLGNSDWCLCGNCNHTLLVREKEYLCCLEKAEPSAKAVHDHIKGKENYYYIRNTCYMY